MKLKLVGGAVVGYSVGSNLTDKGGKLKDKLDAGIGL
jgi:hypothetical protein